MDDKLILKLSKECKQCFDEWAKANDDAVKASAIEYQYRQAYIAKQAELKQAVEQAK